tara:strand:+ start:1792 stop:2097 length:306 start_codon:yes stop_codon:yes gene_type:complete
MVKSSKLTTDHDTRRGMNRTFEGVIVSKEDFTNFEEYNSMNEQQKEYVWTYAKSKMPDMLLQDYDLVMECIIDQAKSDFENLNSDEYYEHLNHQKLNEDIL